MTEGAARCVSVFSGFPFGRVYDAMRLDPPYIVSE